MQKKSTEKKTQTKNKRTLYVSKLSVGKFMKSLFLQCCSCRFFFVYRMRFDQTPFVIKFCWHRETFHTFFFSFLVGSKYSAALELD